MQYAILCAMLLAACSDFHTATPAEVAAQTAALDDAQCRSAGETTGSESYLACRASLAQKRQKDRRERQDALQVPRNLNCKTTSVAGQLYTFCQ
jgi:hypothetical protein